MNKNSFAKRLFTVAAFSLLAATTQTLFAQTRSTEKFGRENAPSIVVAEPTVSHIAAERSGYALGESAAVSGQGFAQFEPITITVEQTDNSQNDINSIATWTVVADENGKISFDWSAPSGGSYRIKATGSETKNQTQTSFVVAARSVTVMPGNVKCKDLGANFQEFKVDPPLSKTYQIFTNNTVSTKFHGGEVGLKFLEFQSTVQFVAVIVKGGTQGANVYRYDPRQAADNDLTTPNLQDISHVSFCYSPSSVPTAATAAVSGTVTNAGGRGMARTMVTIQNLNTEETRTVMTNAFGNYRFNDLPVGNLYSISISNKKGGFVRQTQSFVLNGDEANVNFIASGR